MLSEETLFHLFHQKYHGAGDGDTAVTQTAQSLPHRVPQSPGRSLSPFLTSTDTAHGRTSQPSALLALLCELISNGLRGVCWGGWE